MENLIVRFDNAVTINDTQQEPTPTQIHKFEEAVGHLIEKSHAESWGFDKLRFEQYVRVPTKNKETFKAALGKLSSTLLQAGKTKFYPPRVNGYGL